MTFFGGREVLQNENVQTIFEITRYIYQGEFAKVKKFYGEKVVKSDVGAVIGVMTDSSLIVEEALESEGGMNMCTALEKLEEKGREEGKLEGRLEMKQETVLYPWPILACRWSRSQQ
ncbi:hypothetical protein Lac2_04640 [Claveliimonas bilis]|nr:hypothetical protein Lac2_04640 [Claveliimonas bilis]